MAKKRNIESASVFERSGIRAIRVRAIEVLLFIKRYTIFYLTELEGASNSFLCYSDISGLSKSDI